MGTPEGVPSLGGVVNSSDVVLVIVAVIGALGAIGASAMGLLNRKKLTEIHVLVNSRLDQALSEINDLRQQRNRLQDREDGGNEQEVKEARPAEAGTSPV